MAKEFFIQNSLKSIRNFTEFHQIANLLEAHRDSVSSWILAWESTGMTGLFDKPRNGASSQLTEADVKVFARIEFD